MTMGGAVNGQVVASAHIVCRSFPLHQRSHPILLSRARAAATPTPRPIAVILRGHPFAHPLTKETRASCLDAERPGGYTVAAGALG
jgi:hypothetical protein